jgi:N-acylneuraminate cytidylyltransferase
LIDNAILKFSNSNCDSLRVVTPSPITPYKMWVLNSENNQMIPLLNLDGVVEPFNEPRQNLPTIFWQVGTLDVIRPESITQMNSMSGESIMPYVIDNVDSIDIDDIDSFKRAELLILNTGYVRF